MPAPSLDRCGVAPSLDRGGVVDAAAYGRRRRVRDACGGIDSDACIA